MQRIDAAHRCEVGHPRIVEHLLERALRQVRDRRAGLLHAQGPLGGELHQRLADVLTHLAAQQVEVLRGGRGVADLDVVLRAQRQEALDPGAGVLGTLPLEPVRQQQHQPGGLTPLVLGRHEVLVDDDLGAVDEVAELRLPQDQRVLVGHRVAVLVPDRGVLGQQRVVDPEARGRPGQVVQRGPAALVLEVDQRGVALAERAAAAVLAGQADVGALEHERTEGQRLGRRPLHLAALVVELRARLELLDQLRMRREALRVLGQVVEHRVEDGAVHAGRDVGQDAPAAPGAWPPGWGPARSGGSRRAPPATAGGSRPAPPRPRPG